jgi:hypothetical protein
MNNNEEMIKMIENSPYKRLLIKPPRKGQNTQVQAIEIHKQVDSEENVQINEKFRDLKKYYKNTALDIEAERYIEELKVLGEYNRWSLKLMQRWLLTFYKDKFWITMSIAMLKYKFNLDPSNIQLEICKDFIEGYYIPKENKIYLCANTLTNYEKNAKFKQAIQRHVI